MDKTSEIIDWQGLSIEVLYSVPHWLAGYRETYGYTLAHLEIIAVNREALPITETGYRSHFMRADNIEAEGGPVAYVRAWLDHAARSPEWKATQDAARQFSLFS